MKAILNNPYRVLGLLSNVSARELVKRKNDLEKYINAQQDLPQDGDFGFPVFGKLTRTIDSVTEASSKLNLDSDKMNAAQFWFYKGNEITDEPAFEALKEGDIYTAYHIWDKLITDEIDENCWNIITEKNCSAFHNFFVLEMMRKNGNMTYAIVGNLYFLESDLSQNFVSLVTDSFFRITKKELEIDFLNEILQEIDRKTINLTLDNFVKILNNATFSAKENFFKNVSQKFVSKLSTQIDAARKRRTENKANAADAGETLYRQTKTDLAQLKSIVGTQDYTYSNIADKAANEILQCGIDYFVNFHNTNTDPSAVSMALFNKAKLIAAGNLVKERVDENIKELQKWINNKPERERERRIADDLKFITDKLNRFQTQQTGFNVLEHSDRIANAKDLVESCKPKLNNIKEILGSNDDFYLKLSTAVVNNALGMLVSVVNDAQQEYSNYIRYNQRYNRHY